MSLERLIKNKGKITFVGINDLTAGGAPTIPENCNYAVAYLANSRVITVAGVALTSTGAPFEFFSKELINQITNVSAQGVIIYYRID